MSALDALRQELSELLERADRIKSAIELLEGDGKKGRNGRSTKISGNVAKATRGQTTTATLGDGDRKLGKAQQAVVDFVKTNPGTKANDIATGTGQSVNQVYSIVKRLSDRGIIVVGGKGRGKTYKAA